VWLVTVAVAIEIVLIPIFLFTGADAVLTDALDSAGIEFNTDLVTALRIVVVEPSTVGSVVLSLLQVASPDLALLIVLGLGSGAASLVVVKGRWRWWHPAIGLARGRGIWAACVAVFGAMNVCSGLLHRWSFDEAVFEWAWPSSVLALVGGLLITMFIDAGALFEESAWRGFALLHLQRTRSPLVASVLLGAGWALWHVPVKFGIFIDYGPVGGLLLFGVLTVKFIVLSVVMTHFSNRIGYSVLLAVAMHGLSNDSLRLGGLTEPATLVQEVRSEINLIIPMLMVALALIMWTRGRLGIDDLPRDALGSVTV
jgi:membrane protease YdiL (CAAX protease family)